MPVSRIELLQTAVMEILDCAAKHGVDTVLDVGCGTGLYGALVRQYLDYAHNRMDTKQRIGLFGVEVYPGYRNPMWDLYDNKVMVSDIFDAFEKLDSYDIVLCLDVIEHMEYERATELLKQLYAKTNKYLLVSSPSTFREQWQPPGNPWQNELEEHVCLIQPDIIESLFPRHRIYPDVGGGVWCAAVTQELLEL